MEKTTSQSIYALYYGQLPMILETIDVLQENHKVNRQKLKRLFNQVKEILERDYAHLIGTGDNTIDPETERQMVQFEKAIISFVNASEKPNFSILIDIIKEFHQDNLNTFDHNTHKAICQEDLNEAEQRCIQKYGVITAQLLGVELGFGKE